MSKIITTIEKKINREERLNKHIAARLKHDIVNFPTYSKFIQQISKWKVDLRYLITLNTQVSLVCIPIKTDSGKTIYKEFTRLDLEEIANKPI